MSYSPCPREAARLRAETTAAAIIAQGRQAALAQAEREALPLEEPMKRYSHPIPCCTEAPPGPPLEGAGLDRVLEMLAYQNQLLVELLGAVNSLTAAALSVRSCLPVLTDS